ncbi:M15 family metallopeptidase [Microvirga sp. VF16]|uniref:M15 family metallopeptidase n=1 Tax=Microvirga sp. VF16 TaxID=2807101 RepID=UPI00193CD0FF|nr:M15 family metallopeptidase [Microvirga sp. VF16]QRM30355.1 M15 family metallopeptidase [Microvirga sp. VF16]
MSAVAPGFSYHAYTRATDDIRFSASVAQAGGILRSDQVQSFPRIQRFCLNLKPTGCNCSIAMIQRARFLDIILLSLAFVSVSQDAGAQANPGSGSQSPSSVTGYLLYGPDGVYAKIPARDEFGRDQLGMFHAWNPDPVGHHQANLRALNPILASVVRKAQADNPGQRFVIGSGKRDGRIQRMAVAWGWSRTQGSLHRSGNAVDLWPLDGEGRVFFDPVVQNQIAFVMKKAAAELGIPIRWGGHFYGFKNADRAHFELALP